MKSNLILVIQDTDKDLISVQFLLKSIILKLKNKYKKNIIFKNIRNDNLADIPIEKIKKIYLLNLKSFKNEKFKTLLSSLHDNTPLNIFIMGDFTKRINLLIDEEENLARLKTNFITLGKTYSKFISSFLKPMNQIEEIKIPISSKFIKNSKLRNATRKKMGFKEDDIVLVYSGRISPQKNIFSLINAFNLVNQNCPNLKLLIIGPFDYFENPAYQLEQHLEVSKFPPFIYQAAISNNSIIFTPMVNDKKLNQYLNASDLYINLSTYHDEDLGLSPREAEKIKLPLMTSNWGGFKELKSLKVSPINILNDSKKLSNEIQRFISNNYKSEKIIHSKTQKNSRKIFFQGFNDKAKRLCLSQLTKNSDEKLYHHFYKIMGANNFRINNGQFPPDKIAFPFKINSGYFTSIKDISKKVSTVVLINTTQTKAKKVLKKIDQNITYIQYEDLNKMHSLKHQFNFEDWIIIADDQLNTTVLESRMVNHILANGSSIRYIKRLQGVDNLKSIKLSPNHSLFYF